MKAIYHILSAVMLLAGFTACSNDPEAFDEATGGSSSAKPVQFRFGILQTRTATDAAYKTTFSEGDAIGVFVTRHGTPLAASDNYADNLEFVYSAGVWSCAASEDLYFPADGSSLDFFAYYPYKESVDPTNFTFTTAADQHAADFYAANDLLTGSTTNIRNEEVNLSFAHALTIVNVKVIRGADLAAFDDTFTVTLHNCVAAATVDLQAGTAVAVGSKKTDITMSRVEAPGATTYNYRALVPAQQVAQGTALFSFLQNTPGQEVRYNYTTKAASTFEAGATSKWEITLGRTGLPVYAVGDYFPNADAPEGVVFEINADGTHGKVISLREPQGRPDDSYKCTRWGTIDQWQSEHGVPGMTSTTDGLTATRQLINIRRNDGNFVSDYSAFNYIYTTCNNNNPDGDWYMPAIEELKSLFAAINGLVYADIAATWTDGTTLPGHKVGVDNNPPAAQAFCAKITAIGGDIPNFYGWYCSSTEVGPGTIRAVNFDEAVVSTQEKGNEWAHVRPIRKF